MTQVVAYLEAIVGADITSFRRGMQEVRRETGILTDDFTGMAGNLARVGRDMTYALTTPLIAMGSAAVDAASGFDASMHNINSIAHMTQGELEALSKQVLDFGANTRSGPQAVADSLYEIYSAGVTGQAAFVLMEQSVKTAEAGLANLEKTTNALTATVMAYSNQNLSAADASNIWTKMVQVGVGSLEDFLANSQKVLPLGSALGITFENVGANAAFLSQQGGGAKKAMTALAMAFSNMLKPNETMIKAFGRLGVATGQDLVKKFGSFEGAVIALKEAVKDPVEFNKMFSKTGLEAVLSMTNNVDKLKESITSFSDGLDTATQSAWEEQMLSYAATSDKFNAAIEALTIAIGQQLLPILTSILTPITSLVTQMAAANPEVLRMAVGFGIAVAAAGPLIWIFSSLLSPVGLLIGGIVALAVAFSSNFMGIRDVVTKIAGEIVKSLAPLTDGIKALWEVLTGTGVTLDEATNLDGFLNNVSVKINDLLSGPMTTNTKMAEIKIPVKAGMTLSEIYYSSEWSTQLQEMFSYQEFVDSATKQIKGNDPRWLQVGQDLIFGVGVGMKVEPGERGMTDRKILDMSFNFSESFLKLKQEIQKNYDAIFSGEIIKDETGKDILEGLPVMQGIRNLVNSIKPTLDMWKESFGKTLENIGAGIAGFIKPLQEADWSGIELIVGGLLSIFGGVWLIFSGLMGLILDVGSKIVGSSLALAGQELANFVNIIAAIFKGDWEGVGSNLLKIFTDIFAAFIKLGDELTGGAVSNVVGNVLAFGSKIRDAFTTVVTFVQAAWRDLKLAIVTGVYNFLLSLKDAMTALKDAGLISDDQFQDFRVTLNKFDIAINDAELAKAIETAMRTAVINKDFVDLTGMDARIVLDGDANKIVPLLTEQARQDLIKSIRAAATYGDPNGSLRVMVPLAIAAGMDTTSFTTLPMSGATRTALIAALNQNLTDPTLSAEVKAAMEKAISNLTSHSGAVVTDGSRDAMATDMAPKFETLGKEVMKGLETGIIANSPSVDEAMTGAIDGLMTTTENLLQVKSPSKWAMGVAGFIMAGFVAGFALGTLVLAIATALMVAVGIKAPIASQLTKSYGNTTGTNFVNALADGISAGVVNIQTAVNSIISAFQTLTSTIITSGATLGSVMQGIVDRITGQLNALKQAILDAANLEVPTGPSGGGGGGGGGPATPNPLASGGSTDEWNWVGERGPELVHFGQQGNVIPNHAIRDAMTNNNTENSGGNTIIVNGVTDIDRFLFEMKRRGIKLTNA